MASSGKYIGKVGFYFFFIFQITFFSNAFATSTCESISIRAISPAATPQSRNSDPYWRGEYARQSKQVAEANADVLFIGDSLTNRWPLDLWHSKFSSYKPLNLGLEGDTTQNVLWRLIKGGLLKNRPKAAVVLIGTNNNETSAQVASAIGTIVNFIQHTSPKTKILLLGILPKGPWETKKTKVMEINQIIKKCDDKKDVFFADYTSFFLYENGYQNLHLFSADLLHLSYDGYMILAESIQKDLSLLLAQNHE